MSEKLADAVIEILETALDEGARRERERIRLEVEKKISTVILIGGAFSGGYYNALKYVLTLLDGKDDADGRGQGKQAQGGRV